MPMPAEALKRKFLPDGRVAYVIANLFNAHLTVATQQSDNFGTYDEVYTYPAVADAIVALDAWDGLGEPDGWIRHQPSNRRRACGDPTREEVRP